MKKYLIVLIVVLVGCKEPVKQYDCTKEITEDHVGFMLHGGILDKYDNGRVFVSIVHIVDPKDWDYNEYFTGNGFSKNEADEMKVIESDTCELKQKYFTYLDTLNQQ